jgi:hypothetical protein
MRNMRYNIFIRGSSEVECSQFAKVQELLQNLSRRKTEGKLYLTCKIGVKRSSLMCISEVNISDVPNLSRVL